MRIMNTFVLLSTVVLTLSCGSPVQAQTGTVSGLNTVDVIHVTGEHGGDVLDWQVNAAGSGTNRLYIKIQQKTKRYGGSWKTMEVHQIRMPSGSASGSYRVRDFWSDYLPWFSSYPIFTEEAVRFRLSRKSGTKRIDYNLQVN